MRHRIRAAVLVVEGDSVLLVQHQHDELHGGESCWIPPGGGVDGEESLVECARRETLEETGLSVELGRIAYIGSSYCGNDPHILRRGDERMV